MGFHNCIYCVCSVEESTSLSFVNLLIPNNVALTVNNATDCIVMVVNTIFVCSDTIGVSDASKDAIANTNIATTHPKNPITLPGDVLPFESLNNSVHLNLCISNLLIIINICKYYSSVYIIKKIFDPIFGRPTFGGFFNESTYLYINIIIDEIIRHS